VITVKQHDTKNPVVAILKRDGVAVDLTEAEAIYFHMQQVKGDTIVAGEAEVVDLHESPGWVQYNWVATDTDVVGRYRAEFEVLWPDDRRETFPSDGYIEVSIIADLGQGGVEA
jgi:hypothetical protein